jgi:hypothetical protein
VYIKYVEEADDAANKISQRPEARPARGAHKNKTSTLPVNTGEVV